MHSTSANWKHGLEVAELSDVGMRRTNNQDSSSVVMAADPQSWRDRGHVFIVADGMGAHAAGELASKLAVDNIPHTYRKLHELLPPAAMEKAVIDANTLIHNRGQGNVGFQGMGTTCSVLIMLPEGVVAAHVGDSRIYRLRRGRLEQLTFDHSLVWEMMAAQNLSESEIPGIVPKNVITRSLGPNPRVQVDLEGPFPVEVGDTFLLCSDGLTGPVTDEELGAVLSCLEPDEAARTLIDLANLRGGPDNITVIVVRVAAVPDFEEDASTSRAASDGDGGASVHPGVWVALGVCLLAAVAMFAVEQPVAAAVCVVGSLIAGGVAMLQKSAGTVSAGQRRIAGPLGKGPHRSHPARASDEIVGRLAETVDKLREAALRDDWQIDWHLFDAHRRDAEAARSGRDDARAFAEYSGAIRSVMSELRRQRDA